MDHRVEILRAMEDREMTLKDIAEAITGSRVYYRTSYYARVMGSLERRGIVEGRYRDGEVYWKRTGKPLVMHYTDGSKEVY